MIVVDTNTVSIRNAKLMARSAGLDRKTVWRLKLRNGMKRHVVELLIAKALKASRA